MYLWTKAFHLIFMVTWFAGLFYMFRLFVYWVENQDKPDVVKTLGVMSYKLYYYITTPGMVITWLCGLGLLGQQPSWLQQGWVHLKLTLLVGLAGYHWYIGFTLKRFQRDDYFLSSKQCRLINEVPVFFLLGIVFLAVLKPNLF